MTQKKKKSENEHKTVNLLLVRARFKTSGVESFAGSHSIHYSRTIHSSNTHIFKYIGQLLQTDAVPCISNTTSNS